VSQLLRSQEIHAALSAKLTLHVMAQVAVLVEQTFPQAVHVMILIVVPMMMYVMAPVSALVHPLWLCLILATTVEILRLLLVLKLVSAVRHFVSKPAFSLHVRPLPLVKK
jgi:hypothetical protein